MPVDRKGVIADARTCVRTRFPMRFVAIALHVLLCLVWLPGLAGSSGVIATVRKPEVVVRTRMDLAASGPRLNKGQTVEVARQRERWYEVRLPDGTLGYVRLNEILLPPYKVESGKDSLNAAKEGRAGAGRIAQSASVRGVEESALASGGYNETALRALLAQQVDSAAAAAYARSKGLVSREVPRQLVRGQKDEWAALQAYAGTPADEAPPSRNILKRFATELKTEAQNAFGPLAPQEEARLREMEVPLGLAVTGRLLGGVRLDRDAAANRRVNLIGRWLADHSPRPDLPWTFGLLDSTEVNAYSAPGGMILMTRAMYDQLQSDDEIAAVLAHEVAHVVSRDLYRVIQKQKRFELVGLLALGNSGLGESSSAIMNMLGAYVAINGGQVVLAKFDQDVEYRSDRDALTLLARAGYSPLAMYGVMQQLVSFGTRSTAVTQLLKSHPSPERRLDMLESTSEAQLLAWPDRPYTR